MRLILGLALALAACTAPASAPPLRDPAHPLYAMASLDMGRFGGDWRVVQSAGGAMVGDTVAIGAQDGHMHLLVGAQSRHVTRTGAAQFTEQSGRSLWVLWVDADYRTAVIGSPNAPVAWIIDRATPSPDRLIAARKILQTSGYTLSQFSEGKP